MTGKQSDRICDATEINRDSLSGPLLVAEGLHVLNHNFYRSVTEHDGEALLSLARGHLRFGARALAVNLGTGRKMAGLTPWVVDLLLDRLEATLFVSANILDHPEILQRAGDRVVINAVTADPATLERAMAAAHRSGSGLVVLLVRPGLTPSGVDDRLLLAADVMETARKSGLQPAQLYVDPVLSCRPDPQALSLSRGLPDVGVVSESITYIRELWPGLKTIVGLGTGARTLAGDQRSRIQSIMTTLLGEAGLDAVILDCQDSEQVRGVRAAARMMPAGHPDRTGTSISRAA